MYINLYRCNLYYIYIIYNLLILHTKIHIILVRDTMPREKTVGGYYCTALSQLYSTGVLPFLELTNLILPAALLAIFWGVAVVNVLMAYSLSTFGIVPRTLHGLLGVLLAPFIHISLAHVLANSAPFFFLAAVMQKTRGTMHFVVLSVIFVVLGGLMVWTFGRGHSTHAGASGLIFSYMGFFMVAGAMHRDWVNMAVALIVTFFYGSMLFGVFPSNEAVSWEGHAFGFLVGGFGAYGYFLLGGQEDIENVLEKVVGSEEEQTPILA